MSTSKEEKKQINVWISTDLQRKSKANAALEGLDFQDYTAMALNHFNDHIEKNDSVIDKTIFEDVE
jgi:predicted DNA binding CopG/RHH family protein